MAPTLTNPTTFDPVVWKDAEIVYMPQWLESDGTTTISNSAKGLFPKPLVEPVSIGIIHGVVRKTTYSDSTYKTQLNAVNDDTWRGWDAGQAWVSRILVQEIDEGGISLFKIHYIIRCYEHGWNIKYPQMGYYYLDGGDETEFLTTGGTPYIGKLDGSGGKLTISSAPIISDIQVKREIDFTDLGF